MAYSQETAKRPIIWLKGFTSEESNKPGWYRYDSVFANQFYMKGIRPGYLSNQPILNIASTLRSKVLDTMNTIRLIDNSIEPNNTSILIGHSMGGLVARSWEYLNRINNSPSEFSGIITVATPNQGSYANQAVKNGTWGLVTDRTFNLLLDPILNSSLSTAPITQNFFSPIFTGATLLDLVESAKKRLIEGTIGFAINRKDPFIPAFDDMIPNSNFLNVLNSSTQPSAVLPIINIQCVSNYPSAYRVAYGELGLFFDNTDPLIAPLDQYDDSPLIKKVDLLASILLYIQSIDYLNAAEIIAQPNDTMNSRLVRDPMMIYALASNKLQYKALQTWRALKYDIPVSFSVLFGSAEFSYLPYSQSIQYIRRSEENGIIDGKYLFRFVTSEGGNVVPTYRVKETIRFTDSLGVIHEEILSYMGDDGTLSEDVQEQPYNRLRTERVIGVTHVSVQNNPLIKQKLLDIFNDRNEPRFFILRR